jgi:hypothetical protein
MQLCATRSGLRPIPAVLFWLALMLVPAAAQGTPDQRAACEADAMRLCSLFTVVQEITACMQQNRRRLSPPCRAEFDKRKTGR